MGVVGGIVGSIGGGVTLPAVLKVWTMRNVSAKAGETFDVNRDVNL